MANRRNNPSISSHPGLLVLLLFGYAVLTEGLRTISVPKLKGIEPQVIEIPPGGLPLSLFRNKRQTFSNASHIGVTAKLIGDNHNVAVVHWSGYPSEVSVVAVTSKWPSHHICMISEHLHSNEENCWWTIWQNYGELFVEVNVILAS